MSYIVHNGVHVPVNVDVIDGRTLGMWVEQGPRGTRWRTGDLRAIVWHHTAGEGKRDVFWRVIRGGRRSSTTGDLLWLSVHFFIDGDGAIVQMADTAHVAIHAGKANAYSVGIEIANKGLAPSRPGIPRSVYSESLHGRRLSMLRFHPHQVRAVLALAPELSRVLGVPYRLPVEDISGVRRVIRSALPPKMLAGFRGHLGHYHLTAKKIDPVPHLLDEMMLHSDFEETPTRPSKLTPSRGFPSA